MKGYITFFAVDDRRSPISFEEKIKICLLDLRNVVSPETWEQEHFNGILLAPEVLKKAAGILDPKYNSDNFTLEGINRHYSWFYYHEGRWGNKALYDEKKFSLAKAAVQEYLEKLKLVEFFRENLPTFLKRIKAEWEREDQQIDREVEDILNEKKNDFKNVWKFNIDTDDKDEALKQEALRYPTEENVRNLVSLMERLSGAANKKKRLSALRVLNMIAPYNGTEEARKAVYMSCYGNNPSYQQLDASQRCETEEERDQKKKMFEKGIQSQRGKSLEKEMEEFLDKSEIYYGEHLRLERLAREKELCGSSQVLSFPIRAENLGEALSGIPFVIWDNGPRVRASFGWKIHISAGISSAFKIASLVLPILKRRNVHFKIVGGLRLLRDFYNSARHTDDYFSQLGKFITIYPDNDTQARLIVTEIHEVFVREGLQPEDFIPVIADFQVGQTGGIFARMDHYADGFFGKQFDTLRTVPLIPNKTLAHFAATNGVSWRDYKHPFGKLGLLYTGEQLPDKIVDIKKYIESNLWAPELTNKKYGKVSAKEPHA
ncbi:hypothetical protein AGMMS49949_03830 [Alphaproteobacteria bacterium]|nr:hypothetical protein AGMMS49949_03830 [Alphaproteobacteria bacterium]GHS96621.1 hypothetical protein AGMMS50296_2970 [Alphaproteobacteria bacterium]